MWAVRCSTRHAARPSPNAGISPIPRHACRPTPSNPWRGGCTAGAALKVAIEVASRAESKGKTIVAILASHGIRYTAHPLWAEVKKEAVASLPAPPNTSKDIALVQATLSG